MSIIMKEIIKSMDRNILNTILGLLLSIRYVNIIIPPNFINLNLVSIMHNK
jgi:hypothetical protein